MSEDFSHLPQQMNIPFECVSCGTLFSLFGPEDGSDLCDCPEPMFKLYVSDAGPYQPFVERLVDLAESLRDEWTHVTRDDLTED